MNEGTVVSRYAKALFELASKKNRVEEIRADMANVVSVCRIPKVNGILQNPFVKPHNKLNILLELMKKFQMQKETNAFISLIVKKNRESLLPEIAQNFQYQYENTKNIKTAYIKSASKISPSIEEKIRSLLAKTFKATIKTKKIIDKTLIGGFVLEIDNYQYDLSIKNSLMKIRNSVLEKNLNKHIN